MSQQNVLDIAARLVVQAEQTKNPRDRDVLLAVVACLENAKPIDQDLQAAYYSVLARQQEDSWKHDEGKNDAT